MEIDSTSIRWESAGVSAGGPREESDVALVEAVIRRDPGAHERFLERTSRVVESCLSRVRARSPWMRQEAADMQQRFQLMLIEDEYRALGSFAGRSSLTTWIHVVATRFFHRQAASLKSRTRADEELGEVEDPGESAEAREVRRAEIARVRTALSGLTKEERLLLGLFFEQELDAPEVGKILGIGASGARMRKQRLLEKIAKTLGEEEK